MRKSGILVLVAALSLAVLPVQAHPVDWTVVDADQLLQDKRKALADLEQGIVRAADFDARFKLKPFDARLNYVKSRLLLANKASSEARDALREALRLLDYSEKRGDRIDEPLWVVCELDMARLLLDQGHPEEAAQHYARLTERAVSTFELSQGLAAIAASANIVEKRRLIEASVADGYELFPVIVTPETGFLVSQADYRLKFGRDAITSVRGGQSLVLAVFDDPQPAEMAIGRDFSWAGLPQKAGFNAERSRLRLIGVQGLREAPAVWDFYFIGGKWVLQENQ